MGPSACLDESTVVAFLEGDLAAPERSAVEGHLASCSSCTDLLTGAAADHAHESRAPGNEGRRSIGRLPPGARVDRYQILAAVGRGGMGEVYAAYHPDLDRRIALKVVSESGAGAPERRARLLREARAIARLSHPNVITVHDAGTVDDRVYIAMEFVEGETIDEWRRAQPRSWREILDVFLAAGRGLAAAHAAGIIHRDFKPQNVMIGRDGGVRVMDFGLARLAAEPVDPPDVGNAVDARPLPTTITTTGTLVGTLAYMAPEQFRGAPLDARADQFSFCVALHEALHGSRPALAHLSASENRVDGEGSTKTRAAGAPASLRSTISRGLSPEANRRFASMDGLLAALLRGRTRGRRQALAVAIAALLLSLGGWRLASAHAHRASCAVPRQRLADVWVTDSPRDPRRQAIHRAFVASGRPTAETSWQRVSAALDDHLRRWSSTYVQACEATRVRGEQTTEVLDLRMRCLEEKLDETRALTDVLANASATTITNAVMAARDLAQIEECNDVAALRSAVPPPRDEQAARVVRELRRSINDVDALDEVGDYRAARARAVSLRSAVEATGHKPLLAKLLASLGALECELDPANAESVLEQAVFAATASRDDLTAAVAATNLVYLVGYRQARLQDADRWGHLASAALDRMATPHPRLRAWLLQNQASVLTQQQPQLARAVQLLEQALALKESVLDKDHPDVARSLTTLSSAVTDFGQPEKGFLLADRSVQILANLDPDNVLLGHATNNRAEALRLLGRHQEASRDYETSSRILRTQLGPSHQDLAYPLQGMGDNLLAAGDPSAAIPFLEQALAIRARGEPHATLVADTRFALSRALWQSDRDRARAQSLAELAGKTYASNDQPAKQHAVTTWLSAHTTVSR